MKNLSIKYIEKIINGKDSYIIDNRERKEILNSYDYLKRFSRKNSVYGVNTGFGPMVSYRVNDNKQTDLQYNLVRSHSSGIGNHLEKKEVLYLMIIRLHTLAQAKSGSSPQLINKLEEYIQKNIYPKIYEHGGVGASGDLVQLAHLALGLIGEGKGFTEDGKERSIKNILKEKNVIPHKLLLRDGLSIMNGTACMTSIASINLLNVQKILNWSIASSSMMIEIFSIQEDSFSQELNNAKLHSGQRGIARKIRNHVKDSNLIFKKKRGIEHKNKGSYSLRCASQILGPIMETIDNTYVVVENEINSIDDNPIINHKTKKIVHGGNFHGDYISLEMDKLKIAITKLSILIERQLSLMMHPRNDSLLPPFLNRGILGLNYGMQGMQFTSTSTTAENQMLSNPMSIHSISCNNENQDVVSMGTNSALITKRIIENTFQVLAIQIIACIIALQDKRLHQEASKKTKKIIRDLNAIVGDISTKDQPSTSIIEKVMNYIKRS